MTKDEVRAARSRLGLTQIEMARELGVSIRTYRRWENGKIRPVGELLLAKLMQEEA